MSRFSKQKNVGLSSSDEMGDSQGLEAFLNAKDQSEENKFVTKGEHRITSLGQGKYGNDAYADMNMYQEYGYDFEDEEDDEVDEYNFEVDFSKPKAAELKKDPQISKYEAKKKELAEKREIKRKEEEEAKRKAEIARKKYEDEMRKEQEDFLKNIEENAKKQKERIIMNRNSDSESISRSRGYLDPSNDDGMTKSHFEESEYFKHGGRNDKSDISEYSEPEIYDAEMTSRLMNEGKIDNQANVLPEKKAAANIEIRGGVVRASDGNEGKMLEIKKPASEKPSIPKETNPNPVQNNNFIQNQPQSNVQPQQPQFPQNQQIPIQAQNPFFYPNMNMQPGQYFPQYIPLPQHIQYPEQFEYNNTLAARQAAYNKTQEHLSSADPLDTFALRQEIDSLKVYIGELDAQLAVSLRNVSIGKNEIEQIARMLEVSELRLKSKDNEILTLKSEIRRLASERNNVEAQFMETELLKQENNSLKEELKKIYLIETSTQGDRLGLKLKAEYELKSKGLQEEVMSLRAQVTKLSSLDLKEGRNSDFELEREFKSQELMIIGFQRENEKLVKANLELRRQLTNAKSGSYEVSNNKNKLPSSIQEISNEEELLFNRKAVGDLQAENANLKWEIASLRSSIGKLQESSIPLSELKKREDQIIQMEEQLEFIKEALAEKEEIIKSKQAATSARVAELGGKLRELALLNEQLQFQHEITSKVVSEKVPTQSSHIPLLKQKLIESQNLNEKLLEKAENLSKSLQNERNEKIAYEKILAGLKTSGDPGIRLAVLDKKLQYVEQTLDLKNLHFRELLKVLALEDTFALREENAQLKEKLAFAKGEGEACKEELAQILFDIRKLK